MNKEACLCFQPESDELTRPQRAPRSHLSLQYRGTQRSGDFSSPVETKGRKKSDKKSMVDNLVPGETRSTASLMCCIANRDRGWNLKCGTCISTSIKSGSLVSFTPIHTWTRTSNTLLGRNLFFMLIYDVLCFALPDPSCVSSNLRHL